MNTIDRNHDGKITPDEFNKFVKSHPVLLGTYEDDGEASFLSLGVLMGSDVMDQEEFDRLINSIEHKAHCRDILDNLHIDHHLPEEDHHNDKKHVKKSGEKKSMGEVLKAAGMRALGGGIPGAAAMFLQVGSLMWMRTTMNYQYRHGSTTGEALRALYKEGGIGRFYKGVGPALFQGPLSRFGDTAANAGMLALLAANDNTKDWPVLAKTMCASGAAALWRINLMPIDTLKTTMQVEGSNGLKQLRAKMAKGGPRVLYQGAMGSFGATYVGHFPWFATYNFMDEMLPKYEETFKKFGRNAICGFTASAVSDTCSNSIRVLKTTKQTYATEISYSEAAKEILKKDGPMGLFGRGLQTRIMANGVQGMLFSILWKSLQEQWQKRVG